MKRQVARARRCDRTGKTSFRDRESAVRAARDIGARSDRARVPVRAYQCEFCGHWHLTSRAH